MQGRGDSYGVEGSAVEPGIVGGPSQSRLSRGAAPPMTSSEPSPVPENSDPGIPAVVPGNNRLPVLAPEVVRAARGFADASRAASTRAKYDATWSHFAAWCRAQGQVSLPAHPALVAGYLAAEADRGLSPSFV